jgi:hypothetical protein
VNNYEVDAGRGRRVTGASTVSAPPLPAALLLLLLSAGAGGGAHAPDPVGPGVSGASGASGASPTEPTDPCAGFSWDIAHERVLFSGVPRKIAAGASPTDAPAISPDQLYELALVPYSQVHFAATPGRTRSAEGRAGLATLSLSTAGVYRVALDQPFWVDVIGRGSTIPSRDFQGRPGCHAPHKIVEFDLPAATPLTLQFSAGEAATLRVAVSRAPPPREKS